MLIRIFYYSHFTFFASFFLCSSWLSSHKSVCRVPTSITANKIKEHWDPDFQTLVSPLSTPASSSSVKRKKCVIDNPANFIDTNIPIMWSLKDLVMASNLLNGDAGKVCSFSDEYETRRVYSMVYDVFRCKYLESALSCTFIALSAQLQFHTKTSF